MRAGKWNAVKLAASKCEYLECDCGSSNLCGNRLPRARVFYHDHPEKECTVMVRKTLSSFVLAATCAIFLAVPAAQAQDARHDGLLDLSPVQRQGKIQRECGPISNEHLRASCVDSRNIDEDRRALGLRDGLTGGGDGRMNPIDRTFQGPEMYDPRFGR